MALQAPTVTIIGVTEPQHKLYRIEFRMVATDDTTGLPGLDIPYIANYKLGNPLEPKVSEVTTFFQHKIDEYKRSVIVYESVELETARDDIESGLVV